MTSATRNIIRIVAGVLCMILGVIGLFIPIMPQVLFFAAGIFLLAPNVPICQRMVRWMQEKSPRFKRAVDKLEPRMKRWGLDPDGPDGRNDDEAAAKREARRIRRGSPTRFRAATSQSR